jgi:hypothetical protein
MIQRFFQVSLLKILKRLIFKITNLQRQNRTHLNRNPNISLSTNERLANQELFLTNGIPACHDADVDEEDDGISFDEKIDARKA